jgi:hypothetical protein
MKLRRNTKAAECARCTGLAFLRRDGALPDMVARLGPLARPRQTGFDLSLSNWQVTLTARSILDRKRAGEP